MSTYEVFNDHAIEVGLNRIWYIRRLHDGQDAGHPVRLRYDERIDAVVVASDEPAVRALLAEEAGGEGPEPWLDAQLSIVALIGWAVPNQELGIVTSDYRDG